jgi:hypothetical protein
MPHAALPFVRTYLGTVRLGTRTQVGCNIYPADPPLLHPDQFSILTSHGLTVHPPALRLAGDHPEPFQLLTLQTASSAPASSYLDALPPTVDRTICHGNHEPATSSRLARLGDVSRQAGIGFATSYPFLTHSST